MRLINKEGRASGDQWVRSGCTYTYLRLPAAGLCMRYSTAVQYQLTEKEAAAGRATSLSMVAGETPLSKPSADSGRALRRHRGAGPAPSRGLAASAPLAAPPRPPLLAEPRELGPHAGPREGRPAAGLHRRRPCSSSRRPAPSRHGPAWKGGGAAEEGEKVTRAERVRGRGGEGRPGRGELGRRPARSSPAPNPAAGARGRRCAAVRPADRARAGGWVLAPPRRGAEQRRAARPLLPRQRAPSSSRAMAAVPPGRRA